MVEEFAPIRDKPSKGLIGIAQDIWSNTNRNQSSNDQDKRLQNDRNIQNDEKNGLPLLVLFYETDQRSGNEDQSKNDNSFPADQAERIIFKLTKGSSDLLLTYQTRRNDLSEPVREFLDQYFSSTSAEKRNAVLKRFEEAAKQNVSLGHSYEQLTLIDTVGKLDRFMRGGLKRNEKQVVELLQTLLDIKRPYSLTHQPSRIKQIDRLGQELESDRKLLTPRFVKHQWLAGQVLLRNEELEPYIVKAKLLSGKQLNDYSDAIALAVKRDAPDKTSANFEESLQKLSKLIQDTKMPALKLEIASEHRELEVLQALSRLTTDSDKDRSRALATIVKAAKAGSPLGIKFANDFGKDLTVNAATGSLDLPASKRREASLLGSDKLNRLRVHVALLELNNQPPFCRPEVVLAAEKQLHSEASHGNSVANQWLKWTRGAFAAATVTQRRTDGDGRAAERAILDFLDTQPDRVLTRQLLISVLTFGTSQTNLYKVSEAFRTDGKPHIAVDLTGLSKEDRNRLAIKCAQLLEADIKRTGFSSPEEAALAFSAALAQPDKRLLSGLTHSLNTPAQRAIVLDGLLPLLTRRIDGATELLPVYTLLWKAATVEKDPHIEMRMKRHSNELLRLFATEDADSIKFGAEILAPLAALKLPCAEQIAKTLHTACTDDHVQDESTTTIVVDALLKAFKAGKKDEGCLLKTLGELAAQSKEFRPDVQKVIADAMFAAHSNEDVNVRSVMHKSAVSGLMALREEWTLDTVQKINIFITPEIVKQLSAVAGTVPKNAGKALVKLLTDSCFSDKDEKTKILRLQAIGHLGGHSNLSTVYDIASRLRPQDPQLAKSFKLAQANTLLAIAEKTESKNNRDFAVTNFLRLCQENRLRYGARDGAPKQYQTAGTECTDVPLILDDDARDSIVRLIDGHKLDSSLSIELRRLRSGKTEQSLVEVIREAGSDLSDRELEPIVALGRNILGGEKVIKTAENIALHNALNPSKKVDAGKVIDLLCKADQKSETKGLWDFTSPTYKNDLVAKREEELAETFAMYLARLNLDTSTAEAINKQLEHSTKKVNFFQRVQQLFLKYRPVINLIPFDLGIASDTPAFQKKANERQGQLLRERDLKKVSLAGLEVEKSQLDAELKALNLITDIDRLCTLRVNGQHRKADTFALELLVEHGANLRHAAPAVYEEIAGPDRQADPKSPIDGWVASAFAFQRQGIWHRLHLEKYTYKDSPLIFDGKTVSLDTAISRLRSLKAIDKSPEEKLALQVVAKQALDVIDRDQSLQAVQLQVSNLKRRLVDLAELMRLAEGKSAKKREGESEEKGKDVSVYDEFVEKVKKVAGDVDRLLDSVNVQPLDSLIDKLKTAQDGPAKTQIQKRIDALKLISKEFSPNSKDTEYHRLKALIQGAQDLNPDNAENFVKTKLPIIIASILGAAVTVCTFGASTPFTIALALTVGGTAGTWAGQEFVRWTGKSRHGAMPFEIGRGTTVVGEDGQPRRLNMAQDGWKFVGETLLQLTVGTLMNYAGLKAGSMLGLKWIGGTAGQAAKHTASFPRRVFNASAGMTIFSGVHNTIDAGIKLAFERQLHELEKNDKEAFFVVETLKDFTLTVLLTAGDMKLRNLKTPKLEDVWSKPEQKLVCLQFSGSAQARKQFIQHHLDKGHTVRHDANRPYYYISKKGCDTKLCVRWETDSSVGTARATGEQPHSPATLAQAKKPVANTVAQCEKLLKGLNEDAGYSPVSLTLPIEELSNTQKCAALLHDCVTVQRDLRTGNRYAKGPNVLVELDSGAKVRLITLLPEPGTKLTKTDLLQLEVLRESKGYKILLGEQLQCLKTLASGSESASSKPFSDANKLEIGDLPGSPLGSPLERLKPVLGRLDLAQTVFDQARVYILTTDPILAADPRNVPIVERLEKKLKAGNWTEGERKEIRTLASLFMHLAKSYENAGPHVERFLRAKKVVDNERNGIEDVMKRFGQTVDYAELEKDLSKRQSYKEMEQAEGDLQKYVDDCNATIPANHVGYVSDCVNRINVTAIVVRDSSGKIDFAATNSNLFSLPNIAEAIRLQFSVDNKSDRDAAVKLEKMGFSRSGKELAELGRVLQPLAQAAQKLRAAQASGSPDVVSLTKSYEQTAVKLAAAIRIYELALAQSADLMLPGTHPVDVTSSNARLTKVFITIDKGTKVPTKVFDKLIETLPDYHGAFSPRIRIYAEQGNGGYYGWDCQVSVSACDGKIEFSQFERIWLHEDGHSVQAGYGKGRFPASADKAWLKGLELATNDKAILDMFGVSESNAKSIMDDALAGNREYTWTDRSPSERFKYRSDQGELFAEMFMLFVKSQSSGRHNLSYKELLDLYTFSFSPKRAVVMEHFEGVYNVLENLVFKPYLLSRQAIAHVQMSLAPGENKEFTRALRLLDRHKISHDEAIKLYIEQGESSSRQIPDLVIDVIFCSKFKINLNDFRPNDLPANLIEVYQAYRSNLKREGKAIREDKSLRQELKDDLLEQKKLYSRLKHDAEVFNKDHRAALADPRIKPAKVTDQNPQQPATSR